MVCDQNSASREYWQSFTGQKDFACVASPLNEPQRIGGSSAKNVRSRGAERAPGQAGGRTDGQAGRQAGTRWVANLPAVPTNQLFVEFGRRDETSAAGGAVQAVVAAAAAAGALWPVRHQSQYRI